MAPSAAPAPTYGVQLINKHNDLSCRIGNNLQNLFQTFFKLSAIFSTGNQSCQV